jgi:hypothetical protein
MRTPEETEAALGRIVDRIPQGWGRQLDIGPGWNEIVIRLDALIASKFPNYELNQCKEKFGGLRYYCEYSGDPEVRDWISRAETESFNTCDKCGEPGELVNVSQYWVATRCAADAVRTERD